MDFLSDNINSFNEMIISATEKLSQTPQEFSGGLYSMVVNINEALMPLAIALLMTYFIFSFYEKAVTFKMDDPKIFGTGIIYFAVAVVILKNNLGILNIFYQIGNTILRKVTIVSTSTIVIDPQVIEGLWEDVSFWDGAGAFFEMFFCQVLLIIIIFIANFVITFVVISRMFEIYAYMAFAPIAMCSFVSDTTRGMGKDYIINFCTVVLKSSVIALILQMYLTYMVDRSSTIADGGMAYFWESAISSLIIIVLILGAEKMSSTIVGKLK